MTQTLQQIDAKVNRMKCNLMGKSIKSSKISDEMRGLDIFIGSIDNYTDQERKKIEEIQRAFYLWCRKRE